MEPGFTPNRNASRREESSNKNLLHVFFICELCCLFLKFRIFQAGNKAFIFSGRVLRVVGLILSLCTVCRQLFAIKVLYIDRVIHVHIKHLCPVQAHILSLHTFYNGRKSGCLQSWGSQLCHYCHYHLSESVHFPSLTMLVYSIVAGAQFL